MTRSTCHPWLNRFAWLTAAATFLLLGLGGLVTSHEAGMAVPDWPTTYGYNMFLFPMHLWQGNIFYEHTHRLLASFVGLLTIILAVWIWLRDPRSWVRWLGAGAFFAILLQGLLGGLRVTLLKDEIGIFHAALAQSFFVLVTLIALFSSGKAGKFADSLRTTPISRSLYWLTISSSSLLLIQLILGASMRHQHAGLAVPDFPLAYGKAGRQWTWRFWRRSILSGWARSSSNLSRRFRSGCRWLTGLSLFHSSCWSGGWHGRHGMSTVRVR